MRSPTLLQHGMRLALGAALVVAVLQGQQPAPTPQTPAPAPSPGGTPAPSTPSPATPNIPTPSPTDRTRQPDFGAQRDRTTFPEMQRPIFLSGRVMMEDGTPPPDSVVIERVCSGVVRPEAYTDSKGHFSLQLGQNTAVIADASVGAANSPLDSWSQQAGGFSASGRGLSERDLMACELRASLPGYRSNIVSLAGRRSMDNPEVGTIVLRRLGQVEGTTISFTSLQAPKDARKALEKGREAVGKKKYAEARAQFEKAVQLYPNYAAAWFELGMIHEREKDIEPARRAYREALRADSKFVKPYLQLAVLSAQERKWEEVAETAGRVLKLNPLDFPSAYFYHSVANLNLKNLDVAEKSAREALRLDAQGRVPKAEHLLGVILANKRDYSGAVEHIKLYLERAPDASDADAVRKQLVEIEKVAAARSAEPQPQP